MSNSTPIPGGSVSVKRFGSRTQRTQLETPVPVDVISEEICWMMRTSPDFLATLPPMTFSVPAEPYGAQDQQGDSDGQRNGPYREWDEEGKQRAELKFVDGKLDGTATLWGAEGQKVVQQYEDGKMVKETRE